MMPVSKDALDAVIGQRGGAGRQARWAPAAAGNGRAGVGPSNPSGTAPALNALGGALVRPMQQGSRRAAAPAIRRMRAGHRRPAPRCSLPGPER